MIQISFWAKNHKVAARLILAILHTLLFFCAVYVAILLDQINIHLHFTVPLTAAVLSIAAVLFYPSNRHNGKSFIQNYFRRKGCEVVFLCATLVCICFVFNKDTRVSYFNTYQVLNGSFVTPESKVKETLKRTNELSKKTITKQFKELVKELKKSKTSSGGRIALIALVTLGGIGLTLLLAALSCNLSCNGHGALSTLVLIGGLAVIIFLMVLAIKKINKSDGKE